jgi:hypothetical protein
MHIFCLHQRKRIALIVPYLHKPLCCADSRVAAEFYIRQGTFWTDLVAILPMFAQIAVSLHKGPGRIRAAMFATLTNKAGP